jgi:hypothetical protein
MTTRKQTLQKCVEHIEVLTTESTLVLLLTQTRRYLEAEYPGADHEIMISRIAEATLDSLRSAVHGQSIVMAERRNNRRKTNRKAPPRND